MQQGKYYVFFYDVPGRNIASGSLPIKEGTPVTACPVSVVEAKEDVPLAPIIVDWEADDKENPFNWSKPRKWRISLTGSSFTGLTAATGALVAAGSQSMIRDLHCTSEQAQATLALFALGFGVAPLALSAYSEEFGRKPIYLVSFAIFTLFFMPIALAKNVQTVMISRFIQGAAGSTGGAMVAGTLADIWVTGERGFPMAIYTFAAFFGTGMGPTIAGWVELKLHWRWIEWIAMCFGSVLGLWMALYGVQETRGHILLGRRAEKLRKSTGDNRYQVAYRPKMRELIWISITRPIYLLVTEPVVASISLWIGFGWGVLYGLVDSVGLVFGALHGFNVAQQGMVFLTVAIGSIIGLIGNIYQERLYARDVGRFGPEARLYAASVAGVGFAIGSLIYAWTSFSSVHWIAPCIGLTVISASIFTIYLASFSYLADSYLVYASSALSGQGLVRNLLATGFPLFTPQMYTKLNFRWASTLLGLVAAGLAPIPIVLFFWGPQIRARSKFARRLIGVEK
ncbi:hypothetical protein BS47DRAFT_1378723 [Hydnum rufescens UP504]|uniref:Major facilitator superfamily (MFS) profile domain-containing protein n=1 Tax=Hydnum rufescens UP504 TaxID=1448309 RepID=A0A9P6E0F6_9AGAM|nr:hypothetical protein BS47DRAFT_1378723 [Hydnum rufescens UP504]